MCGIWDSHACEDVDVDLLDFNAVWAFEDGGGVFLRNVGIYLVTINQAKMDNTETSIVDSWYRAQIWHCV